MNTQPPASELLPCPCCEYDARLDKTEVAGSRIVYVIHCYQCGLHSQYGMDRDDIITKWNTRPSRHKEKYRKAIAIVQRAANNSCCICCDNCLACDAIDLLRELGGI